VILIRIQILILILILIQTRTATRTLILGPRRGQTQIRAQKQILIPGWDVLKVAIQLVIA